MLGGLTVIYLLPDPVSISHAGLAQIFFGLTVTLALVTSRGWRAPSSAPVDDDGLRRRAVALTVLVYIQILIGATMRHTGAGLAIPDFPLAFGGLIPPTWTADIAVHYVHRVGAVFVTIWAVATAAYVWRRHGGRRELTRPVGLLLAAIALQITLGAFVVLTGKHPIVNTLHVAGGAIVLVTSLTLALRAFRTRIDVAAATPSRVAPGFGAARPVSQT
jgi:cytochrome c oxidase assembly protein subunit 15